ncbi:MAG: flap endonuclease-1 [Candidatus Aenigmatarchaeota archaeon]
MGVNLREIASPKETQLSDLSGKVVAIDALNMIYQFLSIIRDRFTGEPLKDSKGDVTSHLSGLFYRTSRLMEAGIRPVFVFDGQPPSFKKGVQDERRKIREEAGRRLAEAVKEGDTAKIRLYSQQTSSVTGEMLSEARKLLSAMGVQCVQGPSEGEAQASYMNRMGLAYACGSQDWDCLLFGAERLVRNLGVSGKRKLPGKESYVKVSPEMVELSAMLSSISITREQLVMIGLLVGTDYNPGGVKGIGPKKGLEIVRRNGTLQRVMKDIEWDFDVAPEELLAFFMNPPAAEVSIEYAQPDLQKLREILIGHDFSPERIDSTLFALEAALKKGGQESLSKFF